MTTSLDEILSEYIKDYQVEHAKKAILSWIEKEIVPEKNLYTFNGGVDSRDGEIIGFMNGFDSCRTQMLERLKSKGGGVCGE